MYEYEYVEIRHVHLKVEMPSRVEFCASGIQRKKKKKYLSDN